MFQNARNLVQSTDKSFRENVSISYFSFSLILIILIFFFVKAPIVIIVLGAKMGKVSFY